MTNSAAPTTLSNVVFNTGGQFSTTAPIAYPTSVLSSSFSFNFPINYTVGSGTQQVQNVCTGTALAATTNTITLSTSGALKDPCNNTVSFANVGILVCQNQMPIGSQNTLTVKPGATNGVNWPQLAATGITLTPQNVAVVQDLYSKMAVASGSADQVDFVSNSGTCTFSFVILGR